MKSFILFYNEGVSYLIYTCGGHSSADLQQAAAGAVAIDVSYPPSGSSGVWPPNGLL
jgi:hypothetical protein